MAKYKNYNLCFNTERFLKYWLTEQKFYAVLKIALR